MKAFILAAVLCFSVPMVSCTISGSRGVGEEEKVVTGGKYKCGCGITKSVDPGESAPKCCGKPMKKLAN